MQPRIYDLSTIGGRLGHLIDRSDLTRSALAQKLKVGPPQITAWVKERFGPPRRENVALIAAALGLTDSEREWLETGRGETPAQDGSKAPEDPAYGLDKILADYFRGVDAGLDQTAVFDVAVQKLQQLIPTATRRQAENVLRITLNAHRQAMPPVGRDSRQGEGRTAQ